VNENELPARIKKFQTLEAGSPVATGKKLRLAWLVWLTLAMAWLGTWWWLARPSPSWQHGWVGWWSGDRVNARPLWNLRASLLEGADLTRMDGDPAYRVAGSGVKLGMWRDKNSEWSWADWVFLERLPITKEPAEVALAGIKAGTDFLWDLLLRDGHLVASIDALRASGTDDPRTDVELRAADALPQARWTHLSFTSEYGVQKLFVNGKLVAEVATHPTTSLQLASLGVTAHLRERVNISPEERPLVWHDDITAWDRALAPEEVAELAAAGRGAWGRVVDREALAVAWMSRGRPLLLASFVLLALLTSARWMGTRLRMFVEELPRPSFRPVVIVAVSGMLVTVVATVLVRWNGRRADEARFTELLQRMRSDTDDYWEKMAGLAMRARDWLSGQAEPTPAAWLAWLNANHFPHDYAGVIGIGYAEQVLPAALAGHAATWSARYGFPYRVHPVRDKQRARQVLELAGEPHLPVVLYCPSNLAPERWLTNETILGSDLLFVPQLDRRTWSESIRVEEAVARNEVTSSSMEEIAPEDWYGKRIEGLRLYVPWTLRNKTDGGKPLEPEAWRGVWFVSVDFKSVLAEFMSQTRPLVGFRMHTGTMGGQRHDLVADTGEINAATADRPEAYLRGTVEIPFYHHRLFLDTWTTPAFEAQSTRWWPWWIAGGGVGITALVSALLFVQVRAREAQQAVLDALREANSRLLAAYRDREHLSRDLHDGSIQNLYALGLHLQRVEQLLATKPARAQQELRESLGFLDHSIAELRQFILSAGVESLDHQTTASALEGLVARLRGSTDMDVKLEVHPAAKRLEPSVGVQVLHVVREAVSNAMRHSGARVVDIRLQPIEATAREVVAGGPTQRNGWWRLTVADDGKGFDRYRVDTLGHGLENVAARAKELGGQSDVDSAPGKGAKIVVEFPEHI
jgi:signal transduction histidine kinase